MKTVWKFKLEPETEQEISIPETHEFIHVAMQNGEANLWAVVDTDSKIVEKEIFVYGTGEEIPKNVKMSHLGSFITDENLVFHVFKFNP